MELKFVTMKVIGIVSYLYLIFAVENSSQAGRYKREEDERWIWGNAEDITSKSITQQQRQDSTEIPESMETTTEFNPCLQPPPVMPDFRKPGQRVSETKCLEYKWDIVRQEIGKKKFYDCIKYLNAHNTYPAIGGYMARPGEFPHMAALGWRATVGGWVFKCGGSLISDQYVLTAAHCSRAPPSDTTVTELEPGLVVLGETNLKNVRDGFIPASYNISHIIKHPQFKAPKKYYDIALLKLKKTVSFDHSKLPACLWSHFDTSPLGNDPTLTGWGVVETASRMTSPTLQVVKVDIIDSGLCDRLLRPNCNRNWCGIQDTQICAGKLAGGYDACQGDSGGPLQLKMNLTTKTGSMYYVVGVTSFGHGCALPNTPGVYTRVSEFIDWIETIVWPEKS